MIYFFSNKRFFYFDVEHAISAHDWIIEHTGGLSGLKDKGQIESPLEHIKNDLYYPEMEDKLTHLVFSINKNHAFNDGNKRSSLLYEDEFSEGIKLAIIDAVNTIEL